MRRSGTFFWMTRAHDDLPRTAMAVSPVESAALRAYSTYPEQRARERYNTCPCPEAPRHGKRAKRVWYVYLVEVALRAEHRQHPVIVFFGAHCYLRGTDLATSGRLAPLDHQQTAPGSTGFSFSVPLSASTPLPRGARFHLSNRGFYSRLVLKHNARLPPSTGSLATLRERGSPSFEIECSRVIESTQKDFGAATHERATLIARE